MGDNTTPRPSHLGICVSDMDRSLRFYCEGLGFETGDNYDLDSSWLAGLDTSLEVPGPVVVRSQMIRLGAMKIELLGYASPAAVGTPSAHRNQLGLTHLSFLVDDVDAHAERLVSLGGILLPDTRANLGVDLVFLADPDGVRVELMASG